MSRIDFYFIPQTGTQARLLFACRLLEKAYLQEHCIYVHVENAEKAQFLDRLLWTFRDASFVPHQLYGEKTAPASPIQIGCTTSPNTEAEILLNLHRDIPAFHGRFKRILEVLTQETDLRALAEEHRTFYEGKGYSIHSHQLS